MFLEEISVELIHRVCRLNVRIWLRNLGIIVDLRDRFLELEQIVKMGLIRSLIIVFVVMEMIDGRVVWKLLMIRGKEVILHI